MTDSCIRCPEPTRDNGCCALCSTLRPGRVMAHVEKPNACPSCRSRLAAMPDEIAEAYGYLRALLRPRRGTTDARHAIEEAPIPLSIDPYDLLADHLVPQGPLRRARLAANLADQIGFLPVAVTLDGWLRDWADLRDLGEASHPDRTVAGICVWLRERTDWACDQHPAVDEYAAELLELRGVLQALVGRTEQCPGCGGSGCGKCNGLGLVPHARPVPIKGVPCPRCHRVTLARRIDGSVECQWPDCASVWRADEYEHLTRAAADVARRNKIKETV